MFDPGAADHLRAHEPSAVAAALPPEGLHADARHGREDEPGRYLDGADLPGCSEIDHRIHRRSSNGRRCRGRIRGIRRATRIRASGFWSCAQSVDAGFAPQLPFRPFDGAGGAPPSCLGGHFLKDVILTPEGYKLLKSELDRLRTEKRREIAERIAAARAFGEIAENAEYDDAKNEQMMLEHRIAQLEERLANARVINPKDIDTSVVSVGSVVRLRDVDAKETVEYFIVGSAEANPVERKLSNESPVGKAIMGRKKGETVEVATPRGSKLKFKIMEIKAA
ncbi:MAG: transcription elongation factor GreA [Actinobacteria bacterium]|nr:transcription elongation factor GreA [Actinomycetota bacterium]